MFHYTFELFELLFSIKYFEKYQFQGVYLESGQTSKMELFVEIVNGFQLFTVFTKSCSSKMFDWVLSAHMVFKKYKIVYSCS